MSPENQWLEDEISYWSSPFLGDMLVFGVYVFHCFSKLTTQFRFGTQTHLATLVQQKCDLATGECRPQL